MEPLATYTGGLQCFNNFDYREGGGAPAAQLVVWPDRLEMSGRGPLKAVFRPRTVAKERFQLIRPLQLANPVHQMIMDFNPLASGLQLINIVVSAPKEQRINTGNIHYILGIRSPDAAEILDLLEGAGFPVSHTPTRITRFNILGALSELDLTNRPGHS